MIKTTYTTDNQSNVYSNIKVLGISIFKKKLFRLDGNLIMDLDVKEKNLNLIIDLILLVLNFIMKNSKKEFTLKTSFATVIFKFSQVNKSYRAVVTFNS